MKYFWILLVVAVAVLVLLKGKDEIEVRKYPYAKKMLLTKPEYSFFKALQQKCGSEYIICPKVRMEDFLSVTDNQNKTKYRGYVKSRHIDFLLCDCDLHILAGIELDDKSHNTENAKRTDGFKDEVFRTIGLPLFRIKVSSVGYDAQISGVLDLLKQKE